MGGTVGIVNLDGAPVDQALLARMTQYLGFRGPDDRGVQLLSNVGFGHTRLDLTEASSHEHQPFTLDGHTWIVADARIDARPDLIATLRQQGQEELPANVSDVELILRAYHRWGDDCVTRLLGDFMFAIWDESRQSLFCARDHLGVKPFFYAHVGSTVVISNTLDCIRLHPAVSRDLHEPAIADFLLFGINQDSAATTFRDIRRLPPAHCVTWTTDRLHCRRYWTLPVEDPVYFKDAGEYSERFVELVRLASRDRLRTRRVGVLMSGGMDSPMLAATALGLLREDSTDFFLQAITSVYDRLIQDSERYYAGLVADHLGIPIRYDVRDDEVSIAEWDRISVHTPEPVDNPPAFVAARKFFDDVARDARVLFYGEGPDNALRYEWRPFMKHLVARRHLARLVRSVSSDLIMHRRIPLWSSIRQIASGWRENARWHEVFPEWLSDEFATRCACRERWETRRHQPSSSHPTRPVGYRSFGDARWPTLFESCDLSGALSHAEIRHPFLDLRVLQFMLTLPPMPWCRNKLIIRRSMHAALPREVVRRPKTSVAASPDFERAKVSGLPRPRTSPDLLKYVNPGKIPSVPRNEMELRSALRPLGLSYWLSDLNTNQRSDP